MAILLWLSNKEQPRVFLEEIFQIRIRYIFLTILKRLLIKISHKICLADLIQTKLLKLCANPFHQTQLSETKMIIQW